MSVPLYRIGLTMALQERGWQLPRPSPEGIAGVETLGFLHFEDRLGQTERLGAKFDAGADAIFDICGSPRFIDPSAVGEVMGKQRQPGLALVQC